MYIRLVFIYSFWVIFMTLFAYFDHKVVWSALLWGVISGVPFTWIFSKTMDFRIKKMQSDLLEEDPELVEPILERACMNHFRNGIADGGVGYLLQDRLVFIPHKMNLSKKQLDIPLCDIERIIDYKIFGVFDTGLKVEMKSGKVEKFVVEKTNSFYEMIINKVQK